METILLHKSFWAWVFPLFLFIFAVIALAKAVYPHHFSEYLRLPFNNRYIIIYEKRERKVHFFIVISFFLQWISLSLFTYIWVQFYNIHFTISSGFLFLDIAIFILSFLVLKLLIQRWISYLFDLKEFSKPFVFSRIAYSSYAAIAVVSLLFFVLYSTSIKEIYLYILLFIFLIINALGWFMIIKMNQKSIKPYIIYFILYLCTLEIAPYIFLVYGSRFL
ncbi:MAG: DUF4271 domain-containing protein [Capnocytophaga sp.]|nr:DUF4271 domain-containing protein [Capnocytophaga sp.]